MADEHKLKEETKEKPKLVASEEAVVAAEQNAAETNAKEASAAKANALETNAAEATVSKANALEIDNRNFDEAQGTPAPHALPSIDEEKLRESCLRDLTLPLQPITTRAIAPLIEQSEEANIAIGLAMVPIFALISVIMLGIVANQALKGDVHPGNWRSLSGIFIPMIGLIGISLGTVSIMGRWLWLAGFYKLAASFLYFGSAPAKLLPHGVLNSHLAKRYLCALYLAEGLPQKAQSVSEQFSSIVLTPESAALTDALDAEAAARVGKRAKAIAKVNEALEKFEHLGVEGYIKHRLGREMLRHIGNCYFSLGEFEKASQYFLHSLQATVNADQIDHTSHFIAIINLVRAEVACGRVEAAQEWLELLSSEKQLATKVPAALQGELMLARAEALLAAGDSEQGESLLNSAEEKFRKQNIHPDTGSAAHQLGKLYASREQNAEAETYLRRALKVKTNALPEGHQSIVETSKDLLVVLKRTGKVDHNVQLLASAENTEEGHNVEEQGQTNIADEKPPAIGKKIRAAGVRRQILILGGMSVYTWWTAITAGIRAAEPFAWVMVAFTMIMVSLLAWLHFRDKKRQDKVQQQSTKQNRIITTVAFKRSSKPDNLGLAIVAELGEPFNKQIVVKRDFTLVTSNLTYYARPHQYAVFTENEEPVSIQIPEGFIELAADQSVQDVHKQQDKVLPKTLAIIVLGFVCFFGFMMWSIRHIDPHKLPEGLTAFEYYRAGAHQLEFDWSGRPRFYNLQRVKNLLDRAIELDKNGPIGKQAARCENTELPKTIPDRQVMELYEDGIGEHVSDLDAEKDLRSVIEKQPEFDWAYCSLANLLIKQGKGVEAKMLLETANKLRPNSNMYLLTSAKLSAKLGDYTEAKALIKKAIENDPFLLSTYRELIGVTIGI